MMFLKKRKKLTAELESGESRPRIPLRLNRVLLFFLLLFASGLILSQGLLKSYIIPVEGQIAERDIFPPHNFSYIDRLAAEESWERERQKLPEPYRFLEGIGGEESGELERDLSDLIASDPDRYGKKEALIREGVKAILENIRRNGLLERSLPPERMISTKRGDKIHEMPAGKAVLPGSWKEHLKGLDPDEVNAVSDILDKRLRPSLIYDEERSQAMLAEIREKYPPRQVTMDSKEPIVTAGRELTRRDIDILEQLRFHQSRGNLRAVLAMGAFLVLTLIFARTYFRMYVPAFYERFRDVAAISFTFGTILLICLVVEIVFDRVDFMGLRFSNAALPVAAAATVLTLLYGARAAFFTALFASLLVSVALAPRLPLLVMFVLGSMTGAVTAVGARKRTDVFRAGAWMAAVQSLVVILVSVILGEPAATMKTDALSAAVSGILSALVVPIILVPVEAISRRTSNFRLLELADLNHPLLQALLRKSPGTFQHSQHVALLAQTAAAVIGANPLMTRVGAYFHDIGKMRKPEYFTENQAAGENPHDRLKPSLSASILRAHVTDGRLMGEEEGLPEAVIDFVEQHHGTTIMTVFFHRALEAAGEEGVVNREDFRYPGPKPQNRETAIVMLADTVEAATRSQEKPTSQKLERLVRKVILEKFEIGELDECDLTLKDINMIAEAFLRVLTGMYHTRQVEYPDAEKLAEAERRKRG